MCERIRSENHEGEGTVMICLYCEKDISGFHYNVYLRRKKVEKSYSELLSGVAEGEEAMIGLSEAFTDPNLFTQVFRLIFTVAGHLPEEKKEPVYVKGSSPFYPHARFIGMKKGAGKYAYYPVQKEVFEGYKRENRTTHSWYHISILGRRGVICKLEACQDCFAKHDKQFPDGTYEPDFTDLKLPYDDPVAYEKPRIEVD